MPDFVPYPAARISAGTGGRSSTVGLVLAVCLGLLACGEPGKPDAGRGDVRVVVVSDLNSSYGSTSYEPEVSLVVQRIIDDWRPDLVLAAGDMIAGQRAALSDGEVRAMWAAFDTVVAAPLRRAGIPFGFTLGNHDGSAHPAFQRDRVLAADYWLDPGRDPGLRFVHRTNFPFYYTFLYDDLFVLSWDATRAGLINAADEIAWVEDALGSAAARRARMRIVIGHLPLYAVAEGRNRAGEVLSQPDSLRALLERHGVHTYISGHHHAYYPGRRGRLELLHTGALGQGPRPLLGTDTAYNTVTILDVFFHADSIAYTTYRVDAGAEPAFVPVDDAALPPRLDGVNGPVYRRDLAETG